MINSLKDSAKSQKQEDLSQMEYNTGKEFLQPILDHGMEGMGEVLQNLFNLAMKLERENALKAAPYQKMIIVLCCTQ